MNNLTENLNTFEKLAARAAADGFIKTQTCHQKKTMQDFLILICLDKISGSASQFVVTNLAGFGDFPKLKS